MPHEWNFSLLTTMIVIPQYGSAQWSAKQPGFCVLLLTLAVHTIWVGMLVAGGSVRKSGTTTLTSDAAAAKRETGSRINAPQAD